jgi:hypothetical protein
MSKMKKTRLEVAEPFAVNLNGEQPRREIVARPASLLLGDLAGVGSDLRAGGSAGLRGHDGQRGVDGLGPLVEHHAVLARDAHQAGDDVGRQLARDVGHEVATAGIDHVVDDVGRQRPQHGLHLVC